MVPAPARPRRPRGRAAGPEADPRTLLGGIAVETFLRRHWQKEARLVRDALPGFSGIVSRDELFALATRDDVESRLVQREGTRWSLVHGPLPPGRCARSPRAPGRCSSRG